MSDDHSKTFEQLTSGEPIPFKAMADALTAAAVAYGNLKEPNNPLRAIAAATTVLIATAARLAWAGGASKEVFLEATGLSWDSIRQKTYDSGSGGEEPSANSKGGSA